jgi:cytoskeletal protein RodZ
MMIEIGKQIKAAREQNNLALEEIASRTRISLAYLRDMEQGKFDFLPRPYVIAFTKTFAHQVGLNGEEIAQQVQAMLTKQSATAAEEPMTPPSEARAAHVYAAEAIAEHAPREATTGGMPYLREILIGLGIVLAVVIALIMAARSSQESVSQTEEELSGTRSANNVQEMSFEEMAKRVAALADSQAQAEVVLPQVLTLEARVETPVWMRVAIDDAAPVANTFPRGNAQWQAKEKFTLRVGNAGSVAFVLDGKTLGKVGESGQRIDIAITREGFKDKRILPPPRPRVAADSSGT